MVPEAVTPAAVANVIAELVHKKGIDRYTAVQLERLNEGQCVQILHLGSYLSEKEDIAKLHSFAEAQGLQFAGKHHEIYLNNPERVAPEKLKTIIRYPVKGK